MQIIHEINGAKLNKESKEDTSSLLTNKKSSFFSFSNSIPLSRYQGFYFFDKLLHKTINNLSINQEIKKVINYGTKIERHYDSGFEEFIMPEEKNLLLYFSEGLKELNISLDMRQINNFDDKNREYHITTESGCLLVKYTNKNYTSYLAIATNSLKFEQINQWKEEHYKFDQRRNSQPSSLFVYNAIKVFLKHDSFIVFSPSLNKNTAITNAINGLKNIFQLKQNNLKGKLNLNVKEKSQLKQKEINCAYQNCINSLNSLSYQNENIFAGIPWFYSFWTRDALISTGGFIREKNKKIKNMLLKISRNIKSDGLLPNKLPNYGSNADGIGWLIKRLSEIKLSKDELNKLTPLLTKSVEDMIKFTTKNNLAFNYNQETWMDSIDRAGARIEIQALRLFIYNYLYSITKDIKYFELEKTLKKEVIEKFWQDPILADGYHDFKKDSTIRSNIFIAYYIYPQLLTKKQWQKCFDHTLEKLWMDWGGISTIDKTNVYFKPHHTGENSESYHSGDSWYWINNLTAICLHRLDKKKYKSYINKILESSTKDILYQGFIGHHSEISSATKQEPLGCWAQSWSASMYIELIHEIYSPLKEKVKKLINEKMIH